MQYYGWCIIQNNGMYVEADNEEEAEKLILEKTKKAIINNSHVTYLDVDHIESAESDEEKEQKE